MVVGVIRPSSFFLLVSYQLSNELPLCLLSQRVLKMEKQLGSKALSSSLEQFRELKLQWTRFFPSSFVVA